MDALFGLNPPRAEEGTVLIASFFDPVSVSIAKELLEEGALPYLVKERGSAGVVRLVAGYQTIGTDFFVRAEDEERALALLEPLLIDESQFEEAPEDAALDGEEPEGE